MSLLTPVKVPVKVYRWDDAGAPALDKTAGCVANILKACLVTGYGDKVGAGWTLAFEDLATRAKLFNFNTQTTDNLCLRVYGDTGRKMNVQLAKDAIDANTATMLAECNTPFMYLGGITTGEWVVIASDRGVWFFAQVNANGKPKDRSGAYLFAGVAPGTQSDAFIIKHTGGGYGDTDDDRLSITNNTNLSAYTPAAAYNLMTLQTAKTGLSAFFSGDTISSPVALVSPIYFHGMGDFFQLPIYSPSRNDLNNFEVVNGVIDFDMINFCTSMQYADSGNNAYVPVDNWVY